MLNESFLLCQTGSKTASTGARTSGCTIRRRRFRANCAIAFARISGRGGHTWKMLTVRPTRCVSCAANVSRRSKVCRSTLLRSTRDRSCLVVPFVRGTLTRARTCILTRKICTPRNGKRRNWARSRLHPLLVRVRQIWRRMERFCSDCGVRF